MTTDQLCLEIAESELIKIDFEKGLVYASRFANRQIGTLNMQGYVVATLHWNGDRKQIKLHRLIWIAKNGLIPEGFVLDHINRIRSDNRLVNLRLADAQLNAENRRSYLGDDNPAVKINAQIANSIRNDHKEMQSYSQVAKKYHVSRSLVAQIVRNEIWA